MAIIKCKMCGGDIELSADKTFGTCECCGSVMTLPKLDTDQRAAQFNRGNHFRRSGEFDKALAIYEHIVQEDENDAEAHWCCALCRFGIEYVEDPATYEYLPTCHRASFDSFLEDVDYLAALKHSDGVTRRQYQKDAAKIAEVQRGILATSQNEEPFDVFLCYKETDESGERTRDSLMAQDIYYQLTQEGYRVFFSRITLEDKVGTEFEPYIFAALNSAKVMVAVGTKAEHFNAVWVKNEWSRFLAMMRKDRSKLLLPCYRDMDPYDLPEQLSVLQSYDMSKIGFVQDLIRGIKKVLAKEEPKQAARESVVAQQTAPATNSNVEALLKRGFMALEDEEWQKADDFFEEVLNQDAENANAYLGKLMAELKVSKRENLKNCDQPFDGSNNYQKVLRFGDVALISAVKGDIAFINERNIGKIYHNAVNAMQCANTEEQYQTAAEKFRSISGWKDADDLAAQCLEKAEKCRIAEENRRIAEKEQQEKRVRLAACCIAVGECFTVGLKANGTVSATSKDIGGLDKDWRNFFVAIAAGRVHAVGLKAGGTVVATSPLIDDGNMYCGECDVSDWRDIVAIAAGCSHTIGLKSDGTVVAVGTKFGGACNVGGWRNITAIAAGTGYTVGLKSDGTVIAVGDNKDGQCNVSAWRDIVAIAAGSSHTVGLKSDGTVVAVGDNTGGRCNVSGWRNITAIAAGSTHTVGLKSDGTVVAVGYNFYGQCNVSGWRNIMAVAAGFSHTIGLKSDGTVVAVGDNGCDQCEVGGWKLFNSIDTLEEERAAARKVSEERRAAAEKAAEGRRIARIAALNSEKITLNTELANLHGLFTGKRRREIEARLVEIDAELKKLQ